jgi:hypothetical protein
MPQGQTDHREQFERGIGERRRREGLDHSLGEAEHRKATSQFKPGFRVM